MTARLIEPVDAAPYLSITDRRVFFGEESQGIEVAEAARELPPTGNPSRSCDTNLFLGFFFDGTRNNYDRSSNARDFSHSNVARLYGAYAGQHVPGVPQDPDAASTTKPQKWYAWGAGYLRFGRGHVGADQTRLTRIRIPGAEPALATALEPEAEGATAG
ncbi:MAG TPA: hypothetical protein VFL43_13840 [Variovorax sp.]|nr:hypothetical protein [Variovorax sp.]